MITKLQLLLAFALAVFLLCFGAFHVRMVLLNQTTVELSGAQAYDVGARANWEQVRSSPVLHEMSTTPPLANATKRFRMMHPMDVFCALWSISGVRIQTVALVSAGLGLWACRRRCPLADAGN